MDSSKRSRLRDCSLSGCVTNSLLGCIMNSSWQVVVRHAEMDKWWSGGDMEERDARGADHNTDGRAPREGGTLVTRLSVDCRQHSSQIVNITYING